MAGVVDQFRNLNTRDPGSWPALPKLLLLVAILAGVLAIALEDRELAVGAEVNRALAHIKERSPSTDVVRNRQPATYSSITAVHATAGVPGAS